MTKIPALVDAWGNLVECARYPDNAMTLAGLNLCLEAENWEHY